MTCPLPFGMAFFVGSRPVPAATAPADEPAEADPWATPRVEPSGEERERASADALPEERSGGRP